MKAIEKLEKLIGKEKLRKILSNAHYEALERVESGFKPVYWHPIDIIVLANQNEYGELTEDDANEILENAIDNHDASIGINWDVLDYYISEYFANERAK